jgi:hypothetical protein
MNYALLTELWWLIKVGASIVSAGWFFSKQVSRIVKAVSAVPELKRTTKIHTRQISALTFASKNAAAVALFPTRPPSHNEHIRALEEFDKIHRIKIDDEEI